MVKVAGFWELDWNAPLTEAYLWQFVLRDFGIRDWYMSPVSGILIGENSLSLVEYPTTQAIFEEHTETRVFVEEIGETPLHEFEHPEDAIYVFGAVGHSPMRQGHVREGDFSVRIPTVQNRGVMWPHQCLLTVMYDRLVKSWR